MSVYTQKYVSLPWWYGFIHALNSSGGFFLFPWSSSCAVCFPVLPPPPPRPSTTTPNFCSLLCSLVPTCKGTDHYRHLLGQGVCLSLSLSVSPSRGSLSLSLSLSLFAFSATTLIEATASEYSDVSFVCTVDRREGKDENGTGKRVLISLGGSHGLTFVRSFCYAFHAENCAKVGHSWRERKKKRKVAW